MRFFYFKIMNYSEKLKDPRWQSKRKEALEYYNGCNCFGCGAQDGLNVHHKKYIKGREPWEYDVTELAVLCKSCHETYHQNANILKDFLTNHKLYFQYEFSKIIEILKLVCSVDTIYYDQIIDTIKKQIGNDTF